MSNSLSRRDALTALGSAALGATGAAATAGCLARLRGANRDLPETAFWQFRGDLERRGVHPAASVPQEAGPAWTRRGLNTGSHTAAKASPVPTPDGDVLVGGDAGVLWRVTPAGDLVWETSITNASRGTHGTPAVAGGLAFIGTYDGVLSAVDVPSGDPVWRTDLADAIGSSPAYHDGVVYIAVEYADPSGAVFGVDAATGDVVWEDQRVTDHPHSTLAVDRDAGRLVVGANDGVCYAWTYPDREFAWRFETDGAIKGPVATHDGVAYFGSWDRNVYAVDLAEGRERWAVETGDLVMSGPAVDPATGTVYVGSKDDRLYALDADTGAVEWLHDAGAPIIGCPTVAGEHVLVGSYDATLHVVETATGDPVWQAGGVGRVTSTPLVHDRAVYYADRAAERYIEGDGGSSGALYKVASAV